MPTRLALQLNPHGLVNRMVLEPPRLQPPTVFLVEVCECSTLGL
jgi:hypothetical protein